MAAQDLIVPDPLPVTATPKRGFIRVLVPVLVLLFPLSAGSGAVAGRDAASGARLVELADVGSPEGFQLQEVSLSTGDDADPADQIVSATYLGPGVRNEITYLEFASAEAAESFLRNLDADTCSVRTRATCSARVEHFVVTASSSSTCPHPTADVQDRARSLLDFGIRRLNQPS